MNNLLTLYSSNTPVACHIIKGRLESEGINCYIFDEHIIWIHPFRAVAVGGVKLKVPASQKEHAQRILEQIKKGKLEDDHGEYDLRDTLEKDIEKQNLLLEIKQKIRQNPALLSNLDFLDSFALSEEEKTRLIQAEKIYHEYSLRKFTFTWKQFLYELFDFHRDLFSYLRFRPVEYYQSQELVENFANDTKEESDCHCPNCSSENVAYGYAIDTKWDVLYILFSFLTLTPFPLVRKKNHCFNCGFNFKNNMLQIDREAI